MLQASHLSVDFSITMCSEPVDRLALLGQRLDYAQAIILEFYVALVLLDAIENPIEHRTPFGMPAVIMLEIGLEEAVLLALYRF